MTKKQHRIKVTPHRRAKPDMHKLARALLLLAAADAERAAQAEHEAKAKSRKPPEAKP
jgi:hypothetical protein